MEVRNSVIYEIIHQSELKIEKIYDLKNNMNFTEINQYFYKNKYSILVLNDVLIQNTIEKEEINKLQKLEVKQKRIHLERYIRCFTITIKCAKIQI